MDEIEILRDLRYRLECERLGKPVYGGYGDPEPVRQDEVIAALLDAVIELGEAVYRRDDA